MLNAAQRNPLVRRHNATSFYCFFLGYFSHEIHVCKTVILASRWSTLLEIADLSRYISVGRGELTFIIMKNFRIFLYLQLSL